MHIKEISGIRSGYKMEEKAHKIISSTPKMRATRAHGRKLATLGAMEEIIFQ